MNVFLRLGFSSLLLFCAPVSTQGPECGGGCHRHHGFCEQSGECRCRSGWRGAACDLCAPSADCLHGWCEEPGQCICDRGWTGARCDQDVRPCSSKPCSGNSTCVDTGGGRGHVCVCSAEHTGDDCQMEERGCSVHGSLCLNGGSCVNSSGSSSCLCPAGFTGALCQVQSDVCASNPCVNGGRCVRQDLSYICVCRPPFSGAVCNISLSVCSCVNGGSCSNTTDGRMRCVCPHRFSGPSCKLHKPRARVRAQHHTALHKLLRSEPLQASGSLLSHSQLICFSVLALLTCLVILGSTGIVFFQRCETWMANVKYRQLVAQQRDLIHDQASVNIILPEKIKLSSYTSI